MKMMEPTWELPRKLEWVVTQSDFKLGLTIFLKWLLNFDLENSNDKPDLLTVINSQHDKDGGVMVMDPETSGKDDETEVSTRDGNMSDEEVIADEETNNEGTEQYWTLKLKDRAWKVAVVY